MRKKSGLITAPLVAKVPSPTLHEYICLSSHIHLRNEWDDISEHLKKLILVSLCQGPWTLREQILLQVSLTWTILGAGGGAIGLENMVDPETLVNP